METSITGEGAEEKLLVEEQNMLGNPETSPLLQGKECGELSRPTGEGKKDGENGSCSFVTIRRAHQSSSMEKLEKMEKEKKKIRGKSAISFIDNLSNALQRTYNTLANSRD
ncbi:hypothetical protein RND71_032825 [Anisodus tanguticus]|uniref:Uncharacterized protein n=1 Tax=Anisodus tanguticus TaxID=243964 RepID=A0AAE1R740_9SOLA|nr:hypothetical protein RND71_032825 [Anisodus tanguticus]